MEDRSTTSKPVVASPSQSTTPDIKSPTARPLYSSKLGDQRPRAPEAAASPPTPRQPPVQQKAWTSNKNPITGRSQAPQNKQSVTSSLREVSSVACPRYVPCSSPPFPRPTATLASSSSGVGTCETPWSKL
ncbi:hypothetical protein F5144DRAFT_337477 [Chaetomium tenue]|uniref:Uncharacterized protein n=1 Tax=Chaetomium tenue TaxID=1854479 RepID=A0ACB7P271_9PEZI|nr:hypothetical protein F5144DRAFT_337477 [Chaetomium globosum]